jgi:hypothetical protein
MFFNIEYTTRFQTSPSTTTPVSMWLLTAGILLSGIIWIVYELLKKKRQNKSITELINKELTQNAVAILQLKDKPKERKAFMLKNTIMLLGKENLGETRNLTPIFSTTKHIRDTVNWRLMYKRLEQIQEICKGEIKSDLTDETLMSLCKSYMELYNTITKD